jgi:phage terminase large subunit-like protein
MTMTTRGELTLLGQPATVPVPGCVDCGWQPAPGEKWPSEGRAAVKWMESLLICAEGDWFGKPLRLRRDQKVQVWRWYEYCWNCGYWRYDQALWGEATGGGKTTKVAGLECLEMFGPPEIAPVSPNIINAAASFDQADLLFSIAATMLGGRDQMYKDVAPLCGYAEVYDTEIKRSDGQPGIMKRVAAVAGTNEGGLPSLFVCDELHEWGDVGSNKARVRMVIGKSTSKRRMICRVPLEEPHFEGPGKLVEERGPKGQPRWFREITRGPGRNLNITTAGFDAEHSLAGKMYLGGQKALHDPLSAPRLYFDWREASETDDSKYKDPEVRRRAVVEASAAAGVLWDVEKRVREWDKPEVEHHEWIRYYANRWVDQAAESWLSDHPGAWNACKGTWALFGEEPTVLAVDMALRRDTVAVVEVARLVDGRFAVTAKIWEPSDRKVSHLDVYRHIRDRARELGTRFRGLAYDSRYFELPAEMLEDEEGLLVIEFSQSPAMMVPAVRGTFDMIVAAEIVQDGDPDFARQVKSAVKRDQENGFTLSKRKSAMHIDATVAMCMGVDSLARLTEDPDPLQQVH